MAASAWLASLLKRKQNFPFAIGIKGPATYSATQSSSNMRALALVCIFFAIQVCNFVAKHRILDENVSNCFFLLQNMHYACNIFKISLQSH
jgi:hypothetical protein